MKGNEKARERQWESSGRKGGGRPWKGSGRGSGRGSGGSGSARTGSGKVEESRQQSPAERPLKDADQCCLSGSQSTHRRRDSKLRLHRPQLQKASRPAHWSNSPRCGEEGKARRCVWVGVGVGVCVLGGCCVCVCVGVGVGCSAPFPPKKSTPPTTAPHLPAPTPAACPNHARAPARKNVSRPRPQLPLKLVPGREEAGVLCCVCVGVCVLRVVCVLCVVVCVCVCVAGLRGEDQGTARAP